MYQTNSATFSGWQHYYHERQMGGPNFMNPLKFDLNGSIKKSVSRTEDVAKQWIALW